MNKRTLFAAVNSLVLALPPLVTLYEARGTIVPYLALSPDAAFPFGVALGVSLMLPAVISRHEISQSRGESQCETESWYQKPWPWWSSF